MAAVAFAHVVAGGIALFFVAAPASASWPYIGASAIIHHAYYASRIAMAISATSIHRAGHRADVGGAGRVAFAGEMLVPKTWGGVIAVSLASGCWRRAATERWARSGPRCCRRWQRAS